MEKETVTRDLNVRVHPTLYKQFANKCKERYKTVSEVIRELMTSYVKDDK